MQVLDAPQSKVSLVRHPTRDSDELRAWDAADELALLHVAELDPDVQAGSWLLVNDGFGALATVLAARRPQSLSDSVLSQRATVTNLEANDWTAQDVSPLRSLDEPSGPLDVVIVKVPKTLALLEDELHRIRPHLHAGTVVIGAGMTREVHTSTIALFERLVGPTTTSLARKKARLIHAEVDPTLEVGPSPYPTSYQLPSGQEAINHANVFSRERLDRGTRLLLDALPAWQGPAEVVDLGCGNGAVGLAVALANPEARVTFVDESHMAVASAEATFRAAVGDEREASFLATDGLDGVASRSVDLVLVNPPFHDQRVEGDATAWHMFTESRRVLRPGGSLTVVGNRHLGYHAKLQRIFRNHTVVTSNAGFVVLRSDAAR